jgi:hypothetical protein
MLVENERRERLDRRGGKERRKTPTRRLVPDTTERLSKLIIEAEKLMEEANKRAKKAAAEHSLMRIMRTVFSEKLELLEKTNSILHDALCEIASVRNKEFALENEAATAYDDLCRKAKDAITRANDIHIK